MPNQAIYRKPYAHIVLIILFSSQLLSCSNSSDQASSITDDKPAMSTEPLQPELLTNKQAHPEITPLINIINEHFSQLTVLSKDLNETLIAFTQAPSSKGLQQVTNALDSLHALFVSGYFLDTCCHIYSPKLTNSEDSLIALSTKDRLDQQPLLPGYLDAVKGYPYSGLIFSDIPITRSAMEQEFQLGDPAYVSLGFHALSVILKGGNLNRQVDDFSKLKSTKDTSSAPAELRRTLYAILLASEIANDISILKLFWESELNHYLAQKSQVQVKSFFQELYITAEKELNNLQMPESKLEKNRNIEAHNSTEVTDLKRELLTRILAIKETQTKP
jgi:hypothetical protein